MGKSNNFIAEMSVEEMKEINGGVCYINIPHTLVKFLWWLFGLD
jgi:hypothetical protein